MRLRILSFVLCAACLLGIARPGAAQLASSAWPKQFHDNGNSGRSGSVSGPTNSLSLAYTTSAITNCSVPTVGPSSKIYVTGGNHLYCYTISGATLSQQWDLNLSSYCNALSSPTIASVSSTDYAYMGALTIVFGARKASVIRVNLGTRAVTQSGWLGSTSVAQSAATCPPAIDSSGNVYVTTDSAQQSGGGGYVCSLTSGLSSNWSRVDANCVLGAGATCGAMMNGATYSDTWPMHFFTQVFDDANNCLYAHGHFSALGSNKHYHMLAGVDSSNTLVSGFPSEAAYATNMMGVATEGFGSYPVLNGSYFYTARADYSTSPSPLYLQARSTSGGGVSSSVGIGHDTTWPNACALLSNGNVIAAGETIQEFTSALGNSGNGPWNSIASTAAPSIDSNDHIFIVDTNGDVNVFGTGLSTITVAADASGEIAIVDSSNVVCRNNGGLGLFQGS